MPGGRHQQIIPVVTASLESRAAPPGLNNYARNKNSYGLTCFVCDYLPLYRTGPMLGALSGRHRPEPQQGPAPWRGPRRGLAAHPPGQRPLQYPAPRPLDPRPRMRQRVSAESRMPPAAAHRRLHQGLEGALTECFVRAPSSAPILPREGRADCCLTEKYYSQGTGRLVGAYFPPGTSGLQNSRHLPARGLAAGRRASSWWIPSSTRTLLSVGDGPALGGDCLPDTSLYLPGAPHPRRLPGGLGQPPDFFPNHRSPSAPASCP